MTNDLHEVFETGMKELGLAHETRWALEEMRRLNADGSFLSEVLKRRRAGEPLAYIFGHWQFRDLELHVAPGVLIPRPETEELVDHVIARVRDKERTFDEWRIVDAGAGSGCLGICVRREIEKKLKLRSSLTLIERSAEARVTLEKNVREFSPDARIFAGSWMDWSPSDKIQILVSNPPYISAFGNDTADVEVDRWEPREALYPDDLTRHPDASGPYRELIRIAHHFVDRGGVAAFELGLPQATWIAGFVKDHYPQWSGSLIRDMAGKDRFWVMQRLY